MAQPTIDLRSDTVTRPTLAMREAMAHAEVGDDVIDVDPTVAKLESQTATLLGKEAAMFMPSGTMTNQVAVRIHCKPGDEFICEEGCHIYNYEQAAYAQLSGIAVRPVIGEGGVLQVDQLRGLIRTDNEHLPRTRLVCLENTHNRGAGRVLPFESVQDISNWARQSRLALHLDGARLMNAVVASGVPAQDWASLFDTVSLCFSKGLGAPVGSALAGPREMIREARRHRKLFGGGMRQAGIIAAGAIYALKHNVDRLAEDHANAKILADTINACPGLTLHPTTVDTNIVIFRVDASLGSAADLVSMLGHRDVQMLQFGHDLVRAVTHLDVSREQIEDAAEILKEVVSNP